MNAKRYTVSQVARMANVTVRTLHHYDEIGLLVPSERAPNGYRYYHHAELERLHQILLLRELEFSLEAIGEVLAAPEAERRAALAGQRDRLGERMRRTGAVLRAIDATLEAMNEERAMDTTRLFEGFESFDHAEYEAEAEERWGTTDAWRESRRRTKTYGEKQWAEIKREGDDIWARLAALMRSGAAPTGPEALALAEEHRKHIARWFYDCSPAFHAGLADMYEADDRFQAFFETWGEGFTEFVTRVFRANAAR